MTDQASFLERTEDLRQYVYNVLVVAVPGLILYGTITAEQAAFWLAFGGAILGIGTAAAALKTQRKPKLRNETSEE